MWFIQLVHPVNEDKVSLLVIASMDMEAITAMAGNAFPDYTIVHCIIV